MHKHSLRLGIMWVYIVGHIPPGSDERHIGLQQNGHTTFTESNNKRYLELVRKYSSIIQGQFFGHLHSDSFRIIYDDKGKPVSWMMISPSVTPRKMSIGSNNPAMRLYKFDTDSGQVLDYTQYYTDLSATNANAEPNWVPEYNLTHYYALTDISAISLHNFVDRFTSGDESWFLKYYRANSVRYHNDRCDAVCMLNHYCAITRIDYKEFRQCLEKEQNALRSKATRTTIDRKCLYMLVLMLLMINIMRIHGMLRWLNWNYIKVITNYQQRCQTVLYGVGQQNCNGNINISQFHNVYMKPMTVMIKKMWLKVEWPNILSNTSHINCDTKTNDFLVDIKSYRVETIITMTKRNHTIQGTDNVTKIRSHTCDYCLQQKPEQNNDIAKQFSSMSIKARYSVVVMIISAVRTVYSNRLISNALIIVNNNLDDFHLSRSPQRHTFNYTTVTHNIHSCIDTSTEKQGECFIYLFLDEHNQRSSKGIIKYNDGDILSSVLKDLNLTFRIRDDIILY
uniref:Sphingomyelin phosphodiesterase C-terminal domain-containing protein n=1 Tax=Glossina brevipalpis TaxID=37001 RepID=A0A1A9WG54_9MUSC